MIDVDKAVATAVKTGKVAFGADEALRSAKTGKAQLIIVASNGPSRLREDLEYYVHLSQVPMVDYRGNNVDLGVICGKRFPVAALTVKEPGDSDVLKLAEDKEAEHHAAEEHSEEQ
jgi:large subunit ribosomal protein L30e